MYTVSLKDCKLHISVDEDCVLLYHKKMFWADANCVSANAPALCELIPGN